MSKQFDLDILLMELHVAIKKIQYKMEELERADELYGDVAKGLELRLEEHVATLNGLIDAAIELSEFDYGLTVEGFLESGQHN